MTPSSNGRRVASLIVALATLTWADLVAMVRAISMVTASRSSGAVTRLARPMRSARAASTLAQEDQLHGQSIPSRWTARWVPPPPGMRPRLISREPEEVRRSETIRMSQTGQFHASAQRRPIHHRQRGFAHRLHDLPDVPVVEDAPDGGTVLANEFGNVRSRGQNACGFLRFPSSGSGGERARDDDGL